VQRLRRRPARRAGADTNIMRSPKTPRKQLMQALSGPISEKLVTVEDNASWPNLELGGRVIFGGPRV